MSYQVHQRISAYIDDWKRKNKGFTSLEESNKKFGKDFNEFLHNNNFSKAIIQAYEIKEVDNKEIKEHERISEYSRNWKEKNKDFTSLEESNKKFGKDFNEFLYNNNFSDAFIKYYEYDISENENISQNQKNNKPIKKENFISRILSFFNM